jgi:hypothetical protein
VGTSQEISEPTTLSDTLCFTVPVLREITSNIEFGKECSLVNQQLQKKDSINNIVIANYIDVVKNFNTKVKSYEGIDRIRQEQADIILAELEEEKKRNKRLKTKMVFLGIGAAVLQGLTIALFVAL